MDSQKHATRTEYQSLAGKLNHISGVIAPARNSLLDIILTNSTNYAYCGNVSLDLSDHLPIYINRKKPKTNKTMVRFEGRSYRNYDPGILSEMLINDDWNTFYDSTDPDKCWENNASHNN